jgi:hypothetical protein
MTTEVLGSLSFIDQPSAGGIGVLLNYGSTPGFLTDIAANRPINGNTGQLFIDTTNFLLQRDNGTTWDTISAVPTYLGTTNQVTLTGTTFSLSTDLILPGTSRVRFPVGTTAQRPASPAAGDFRFNSTLGYGEKYTGAYWSPLGLVLQVVTGTIAASSGTTTVPLDNTTPQIAEGNQIWSQSFTPLSATSRIYIRFNITSASSITTATNILSVFAGSTNIGAVMERVPATAGFPCNLSLQVVYSPGSSAAITFSARQGSSAAATCYCNQSSASTLGGVLATQFTIMEIE